MADIALQGLTNSQAKQASGGFRAVIARWRRVARERAELARVTERDLRDMGLTRAQAEFEANKPFWQS